MNNLAIVEEMECEGVMGGW